MKVSRLKKKQRTLAGKAGARKAKRKVSKPRRARRKAAVRRTDASARRVAAPKTKAKAKTGRRPTVTIAVAGVIVRGRMGPRYAKF